MAAVEKLKDALATAVTPQPGSAAAAEAALAVARLACAMSRHTPSLQVWPASVSSICALTASSCPCCGNIAPTAEPQLAFCAGLYHSARICSDWYAYISSEAVMCVIVLSTNVRVRNIYQLHKLTRPPACYLSGPTVANRPIGPSSIAQLILGDTASWEESGRSLTTTAASPSRWQPAPVRWVLRSAHSRGAFPKTMNI